MKKSLVTLVITVMLTCMLTGCSSSGEPAGSDVSDGSKDVIASTDTVGDENTNNVDSNTEADASDVAEEVKNQFSMQPYGIEDASAVISYDDEKLYINLYDPSSVSFETKEKGDEFTLRCTPRSAQEFYDEEVQKYVGNENHDWDATELKEVTVGEVTVKRFDIERKVNGQWADRLSYFVVELQNGISVYGMAGYLNQALYGAEPLDEISLEEWVAMVLLDVTEGDGLLLTPYRCYEIQEQEGLLSINLKHGDTYEFDYDQEKIWVDVQSMGGFHLLYNLEGGGQTLVCDISDRYHTFEQYAEAMVEDYADCYTTETVQINGREVMIGTLGYNGTGMVAGHIIYVELENGVALYGINVFGGSDITLLRDCLDDFFGGHGEE